MAVRALKNREVSRVVLSRPAVEAGEKLGFLPGDLREKVDPYMRPLFDALDELLDEGVDQVLRTGNARSRAARLHARPHAVGRVRYSRRGAECHQRSAEDVSHASGRGSKMVVTGDVTQIDLPRGNRSGLRDAADGWRPSKT